MKENGDDTKQFTMRIPESVFEETKKEAAFIGSSHNSYLMMLIHLGRKVYNSSVMICQKTE